MVQVKILDDKLKMKQIDKQIIITALCCITLLECVALYLGFNGTLLKIVLVVIAGAAGIALPTPKIIK